jgi:hypothetical protein
MDVFDLPEPTDMIMCYGEARGHRREALGSVSTNGGFLAEIIHTTKCLLDFINTFEKWDLFILGMLAEDGAT